MTIKAASSQDMRELADLIERIHARLDMGAALLADDALLNEALIALDQAAAQRKGLVDASAEIRALKAECGEDFYEVNGSIYADAYVDGLTDALNAIAALHLEGKSETSEIEADMIAAGAGGMK